VNISIRRLGPGDEAILTLLAREEADFDLDGRGAPLQPLAPDAAGRYLENPVVVQWVALDGEEVVGDLLCFRLPLRAGEGEELLLYEIGVRSARRREGIGRALLGHMDDWMTANGVSLVWVIADNPAAVDFYRACGFAVEEPGSVYMERRLEAGES
jgi:GNAT superfamily N-acetyltransferase